MAAINSSDFQNAASDIGGAVASLFGAKGAAASASSYENAAGLAEQNALITKQQTAIKETQQSRELFQTIGKQRAGVAGAGFASSGTALDLLRSSASQGALTKAMTSNQGAITENSYAEQAGMFQSMADAAKSSSTAQTVGGILQGAGGLYNLYNGASKLYNATNAASAATGGTSAGSVITGNLSGAGSALTPAAADAAAQAAGFASNADAIAAGIDYGAGAAAVGAATSIGGIGVAAGSAIGAEAAAAAAAASSGIGVADVAAAFLCFITTAIVRSMGKPDDCDELTIARAFRDGWMKDNHPDDIPEYYRIAPPIVIGINARTDADAIWLQLNNDYLMPFLACSKAGRNDEAYRLYHLMVKVAQEFSGA